MNAYSVWTIHLSGLFSLLQVRKSRLDADRFLSSFIETLGLLDLPIFTIGRQTRPLCIWYNHCRFKDGVEPLSGLPYSLLDLFSMIEDPDIENRLWAWSYQAPDPRVQQAWDMNRLAAIMSARELQSQCRPRAIAVDCTFSLAPLSDRSSASTDAIVHHILGALELLNVEHDHDIDCCPWWSSLLFVLFITGSQNEHLTAADKGCINNHWKELYSEEDGQPIPYFRLPLVILHELWTNKDGKTATQLAYARGLEISLL